ncbi:MAG TPA: hypothetical protein VJ281_07705 [Chthoniobacterales bacterium]|jgi:hypothetical protein|nr:hypothetical protein [Chthoniobacterales bacterium]
MKPETARGGKTDDGMVFTHHGHACTVRRSRRHHDHHLLLPKKRGTIVERLFLPLLPRLSFGEIV